MLEENFLLTLMSGVARGLTRLYNLKTSEDEYGRTAMEELRKTDFINTGSLVHTKRSLDLQF